MALSMARPTKHPRTAVYWFHKRVPLGLRGVNGKIEITKSLGTREQVEA